MWRNENKGKRREEKKEVRRMEEDKKIRWVCIRKLGKKIEWQRL